MRPEFLLRFKSAEQRDLVKSRAAEMGVSVNEYILGMLEGSGGGKADAVALSATHSGDAREGMQIAGSSPVQSRQDERYSDPAFEEFSDSMREPKNPCPDCGAELGWNEKRKIYECKCGFIKKGRK